MVLLVKVQVAVGVRQEGASIQPVGLSTGLLTSQRGR